LNYFVKAIINPTYMLNLYSILRSRVFIIPLLLLLISFSGYAQNKFRSVQSGNWSDVSSWEEEVGGVWVPASAAPDINADTIYIQDDHTVTVTSSVNIDQVYISGAGVLVVNSGVRLTLEANASTDYELLIVNDGFFSAGRLDVYGTLRINHGAVASEYDGSFASGYTSSSSVYFKSGGTYEHNYTTFPGQIIGATWETGSTCLVMGFTSVGSSAVLSGTGQAFYNFTYDCPSQSGNIGFSSEMTNIYGDLNIISTGIGNSVVRFCHFTGSNATALTVDGSVTISGTSKVIFSNNGTGHSLYIKQNLSFTSSGNLFLTNTGTATLSVDGNFTQSAGTINLASSTAGTGISTFNLKGNFTQTGGTLTRSGSVNVTPINFTGTAEQVVAKSGVISGYISYNIQNNAIVNLGTSQLTGRTTTVAANGRIKLGSLNATSVFTGNFSSALANTFTSGCTIDLVGAGNQVLGTGFPAGVNLRINSSGTVSMSENMTISNSLYLTSGSLNIGNYTLTVTGTLDIATGTFTTTQNSNLLISGTGSITSLPFSSGSSSINNLTLQKSGSAPVLNSNLTVYTNLTLGNTNLIFNDKTLKMLGTLSNTGGGILTGNSGSRLEINGTGDMGILPLAAGTIKTIIMNQSSSGLAQLLNPMTVSDTLSLLNGGLSLSGENKITMGNGGTVIKSAGTIGSELQASGSYNLVYQAAGTTSNEFASSSTAINNLTINAPGIVLLGGSRTVNGTLTLSSGVLSIGSNILTLNGGLSSTSGSLTGGTSSDLTIGGSAGSFTLPAISGGVKDFTLNRSSGISLGASLVVSGGLTLTSGALSIGANTLDFKGLVVGAGTLTGGSTSNLIVNTGTGITLPAISGGLNDLTLQRGSGMTVTLANTLTVTGDIYLKSGILASAGFLNVDLNTGSIAYVSGDAGSITGNIRVFKSMNRNKYNYISSPVKNSTKSDLTNAGVLISALYEWQDGARTASSPKEGWVTTGSTVTNNGKGYAAYAKTTGTLDLTGSYTHGENVSVSLAYNNIAADDADNGYNLVGNPFPSALNWSSLSLPAGVGGDIQFYIGNGAYQAYSYGGFPATNLDIPPFQAVMVRTTVNGAVLNLSSSARNTNDKALYRTTGGFEYAMGIKVSSGNYSDKAYFRFIKDATDTYDTYYDALKFKNDATQNVPSLYTQSASQDFAINTVSMPLEEKVIPLQLDAAFTGTYVFNAEEMGSFYGQYNIYLEDKLTGIYQDLLANPEYTFKLNTLDEGKNRFNLILQANEIITGAVGASDQSVAIKGQNENLVINFSNIKQKNAKVSVFNIIGQELKTFENVEASGSQVLQIAPEQNGVYIVKVIVGESVYSDKVYLNR
jgi:hypothetical protein